MYTFLKRTKRSSTTKTSVKNTIHQIVLSVKSGKDFSTVWVELDTKMMPTLNMFSHMLRSHTNTKSACTLYRPLKKAVLALSSCSKWMGRLMFEVTNIRLSMHDLSTLLTTIVCIVRINILKHVIPSHKKTERLWWMLDLIRKMRVVVNIQTPICRRYTMRMISFSFIPIESFCFKTINERIPVAKNR